MRHDIPLTGLRRKDTVSSTPKGLNFVRAAIARAVCPDSHNKAASYAEQRWGPKAALITKATVPALNEQADGGSQTVAAESGAAEFFDVVRASSIIGRLPVMRVPFFTRTLTLDEGPRVAWRDEGGAYGSSPLKMTNSSGLDPFDVGALIVSTDEVLRDANIDADVMIRDQLAKALAAALDAAFIDSSNSGTSGIKPASVTNGASSLNSPSEALFDWSDEFTGDPSTAWIIVNPHTAARLSGAARPNLCARGGSWGGYPVITSTAVGLEEIVLIDPTQIAVALGNVDIRSSQEASVDMSDSSSMSSASTVAAASMTSMFATNSHAFIGSVAANWRVLRPGAVMVFNTQSYGL